MELRSASFILCFCVILLTSTSLGFAAPSTEADLGSPVPTAPAPADLPDSSPPPPDQAQTSSPPTYNDPEPPSDTEPPKEAEEQTAEITPTPSTPEPISEVKPVDESSSSTFSRFEAPPEYQTARPVWGIQTSFTPQALSSGDLLAGQSGSKARRVALDFDFQPPWIQAIGVIALGPQVAIYSPVSTGNAFSARSMSLWSAGIHAKYQLRVFREQILVPYVGASYDRLSYAYDGTGGTPGQSGSVNYSSTLFGAMLLLSPFETSSARSLYQEWGISRTYLVFESRKVPSVSGKPFPKGQNEMQFGLRIEML